MTTIIGHHTTKFGELWQHSLFDLVKQSVFGALKDSGLGKDEVEAIFFGNMLGGVLENNLHGGAKLAEMLGLNIPIFRVESACASGGVAFNLGMNYITSSQAKTVLVVGAEKMTDYAADAVISGLSSATSGEEKYSYTEKHLAYVSVKNHYHGLLNDNAHFQKKITVADVLASPYVADPLKVLDSSPISDGASALIITTDKSLIKKAKRAVSVLASEVATDSISLSARKNLDELLATRIAAEKAFREAKITPKDISIAEVHDCFSIAELLAMEDLGFWKKGTAGKHMETMSTMHGNGSDFIVNSSGGLKAAGHPVGATGIKQIGEVYLQLTEQAGKRQIHKPRYGLAHNVGGSGGTAVVTILGN